MPAEAADAASGSAQTRTCAGPPSARSTPSYTTSTSPFLLGTATECTRLSYHPITSNRAGLLPVRNRPANRAATFASHTEAIKRLEQKRMLPRFSLRFVFALKWSAIYVSLGAIDTLSGASFTAATYQDGAALGFFMFPLGSR